MTLAQRLRLPEEEVARIDLLSGARLPPADVLLDAALERGPEDPDAARALFAAALLSEAAASPDGRRAATLSLLAALAAHTDAHRTLGPAGAAIRAEVMPNGWRYTITSWPRLRYAVREGLLQLFEVRPEDEAVEQALLEVTRISAAEPEPVSVAIREQWPEPRVSFAVSILGLILAGIGLRRTLEG